MIARTRTTQSIYGYLEWVPVAAENAPLIIHLHGIGEKGPGTFESLQLLYRNCIPKLFKYGKWTREEFIVICPQGPNMTFNSASLHKFIEYIKANYPVDPKRIYLTGLSAGAISIWNYLCLYQDQAAAVIPICGNGNTTGVKANLSKFAHIPLWAFHGSADTTVRPNGSIIPVGMINALNPPVKARVTIYSGVGHNSWDRTYDLSGMSSRLDPGYDPYDISIYDWLLQFKKQ